MDQEKEKWITAKMDSLKGIQPAQPRSDLFDEIERQAFNPGAKIVAFSQWRMAIAVSFLLLVLNLLVIRQQLNNNGSSDGQSTSVSEPTPGLISDFNLYDL